jgi:hypothetical protein
MKDDVKTEHESWCLVSANRVSGRSDDLFATSIDHQHTVQLTISRAAEYRSHGYGHYLDREQLILVEMSPMQWAELITSMNCGQGAPCTLRRLGGKQVKGQKHETETVRIQGEFSDRAKEVGRKMREAVNEVKEKLAKTTASKKVQTEIVDIMQTFARNFDDYMPFMHKLFVEACEGTVTEAKSAVDAFVTHAVVSAGLEHLGAEVQNRLIGMKEDSDESSVSEL